ncbi:MAG: aminoglycoside phosphotransferase [Cellulosilyticum sp.]|nr:aminoglycoside phosphotransferase [Cellulosilyticum sp.]
MINDRLIELCENGLLSEIARAYSLDGYLFNQIEAHDGGRNLVYICSNDSTKYVLRLSCLADRTQEDYLAEIEFVHYLSQNGASVSDVILSNEGNTVTTFFTEDEIVYVCLFNYAKGDFISDHGYKYREGVPLSEYFYNTGKTIGKIHNLSKKYIPKHKRFDYNEHYNMDYISTLIPDKYTNLKEAIAKLFEQFGKLEKTPECYGLVHFDFSDGNYHIDYSSGEITVFDFDNCCYCWYMFDLANLWTHGVGWIAWEKNAEKRREFMKEYFNDIVSGYRSETSIDDKNLEMLPLFINMGLVENIVDEFECALREGEELDYEDIEDAAECIIHGIPYAGFFREM